MTTSGTPAPALSDSTPVGGCTASSLPSGLSFTDNGDGTAKIAATASAITGGVYTLCLTAANGVSPNATQKFLLTVDQAPSITSANHATFTVGMTGRSRSRPARSRSLRRSPMGRIAALGVTFMTTETARRRSRASRLAGMGSITFTITANNGVARTARSVHVDGEQAPAIASASSATFTSGRAGSIAVTATGFPTPALRTRTTLAARRRRCLQVSRFTGCNGRGHARGDRVGGPGWRLHALLGVDDVSPAATQKFVRRPIGARVVSPASTTFMSATTGAPSWQGYG